MYYVYVDWTTDETNYAFYVGCGNERRISRKYRNMFHRRLAQKHGFRREIVMGPVDSQRVVLDEEVRLIKELNTFHGDNPRCANFTRGGDGAPGHAVIMTDEWRAKIASTLRGRPSDPVLNLRRSQTQLGKKKPRRKVWSDEEREQAYASRKGRDLVPPASRRRQAEKLRGRKRPPFTEEHKQKLREAALRRRESYAGR